MSTSALANVPPPLNEPVRAYAPSSAERTSLQRELARQEQVVLDIPCVVGGKRIYTGVTREVTMPCDHRHVLARVHLARPEDVAAAVSAAEGARADWSALPWEHRAAVLLRAADGLTTTWRDRVNAATMLGQSKTCHQAEIDAACELIDFWRFNVHYYRQILQDQPPMHGVGTWNRLDHRPLDGFVFAVAPFNFTSIALNLPTAPALVGNTVIWKPSTTSAVACWYLWELLEEVGLPPGVINVLWGDGADVGDPVLARPELAGIHFTGSTAVFQHMWRTVGDNIANYRQYPRIVGETGGKDFIFAHPSAEPRRRSRWPSCAARSSSRGRSARRPAACTSRRSLWPDVSARVAAMTAELGRGTSATSRTSSAR